MAMVGHKVTQIVYYCYEKLLVNKNGDWLRLTTTSWTTYFHISRTNFKMFVKKLEGKPLVFEKKKKIKSHFLLINNHNSRCINQKIETNISR